MHTAPSPTSMSQTRIRYVPPSDVQILGLSDVIRGTREIPDDQQQRFGIATGNGPGLKLWCAGDTSLIHKSCVAIVGTREVSTEGAARARRLARELAKCSIVIVSGLARGVDTEALTAAIDSGGRTIAVIGTPIDKASPVDNSRLQEQIYRDHLLISQFAPGKQVFKSNFPERNKLMAAISDATVIIEATDTSGTIHQAWECVRLKRWLFIASSLVENSALLWPKGFMAYPNVKVLKSTSDILDTLGIVCQSK
jgi:DNA processing protein